MTSRSTSPQPGYTLSGDAVNQIDPAFREQSTTLTESLRSEIQQPVPRDLEEQSLELRRAPTRAIFDDLSTAVSSIRSGSARGPYRADSHASPDGADEETSIPLQDLQSIDQEDDPALDLPTPSVATRLSQSMSLELDTVTFPPREAVTKQQPREQSWNPIKRTLAAFPSFNRGGTSDVTSQLPRYSSDPIEPVKRNPSEHISGLFQNEENSLATPSKHNSSGNWTRIRNRAGQCSMQEGSTINNIIRQYKGSNIESNPGMSYDSGGRRKGLFDHNLSQSSDDESFFSRSDDGIRRSYSDRQRHHQFLPEDGPSQPPNYDLPLVPKNSMPRSEGRNDLASVESYSEDFEFTSSELSEPNLNETNPFRMRRNRSSTRFILNDQLNASQNTQARRPLEQDIMQLRHMSDCSFFSMASNSTIQQYGSPAHSSYQTQQPQTQLERPLSEVIIVDEETRRLAEPILFYDQQSIDPKWNVNNNTNALRVPIAKPNRHGRSKPGDQGASQGTNLNTEDDPEDWETVTDEQGDREGADHRAFRGGTVAQTSSSISYDSDNATFGAHHEVSGFSSTERIIQHPGKIHYHRDYRQLDLKETNIPIMAPKYGGHRVNGYAADSLRTRPPHPYLTPSPLGSPHKHPFASRPPEVMSPMARKPTGMPRPSRGKNHFTPSSIGSSIITDDGEIFPKAKTPKPKLARPKQRQLANVQDEIDSIFSTQSSLFVGHNAQNPRPSWDYTSTFAKGGRYNHAGSRQAELPNSSPYLSSTAQADGFTEVSLYAGRNTRAEDRPTKRPDRSHFGKDPRDDFIYRSPLAPPQRNSCRALYTKSQLGRIDFAGEAAGMFSSSRQSQYDRAMERHTDFKGLRHTYERDRQDRYQENASNRKEKISNICLGLCNFFPPLLLLFATGHLDIIIIWWSSGEFCGFRSRQKRWAWYLVCAWLSMLIVTLVAVFIARLHKISAQKG